MPNIQLASYFSTKNINLSINFEEIKETDTDKIFDAFNQLTSEQQNNIESDFQAINAMATEGGIKALIDESAFYNDESFSNEIASIEGLHAKVMWAFLEKEQYWRGANMFLHADNVSYFYWKGRNDLPNLSPHVEDDDIQELANAIGAYFRKTEGRGKNCKVEPYHL